MMRPFLLLLALFIFASSVYADHEKTEPSDGTVASFKPVAPPQYLELTPFYDVNGNAVDFSHFRGKVLLVNIWATWCGPCLRELPALQRLAQKFEGADFELVAISIDEEGIEVAKEFYQKLGIDKLALYNDAAKAIGNILPIDVVPANYIVNRQGEVVAYLRSYVDWDDKAAFHYILNHVAAVPYRLPDIPGVKSF